MRVLAMMLLSLAACAAPGTGHPVGDAASIGADGTSPISGISSDTARPSPAMPFSGTWQACAGAPSPEECSRYLLVQHGDRICGTWSYVASGKGYDGKVVARAISATEARRTHICGRPGVDTDTECDDGWQVIDKPLLLCDGKLGDLVDADGACLADYQAVPTSQDEWDALSAQPWMRDCLSSDP